VVLGGRDGKVLVELDRNGRQSSARVSRYEPSCVADASKSNEGIPNTVQENKMLIEWPAACEAKVVVASVRKLNVGWMHHVQNFTLLICKLVSWQERHFFAFGQGNISSQCSRDETLALMSQRTH